MIPVKMYLSGTEKVEKRWVIPDAARCPLFRCHTISAGTSLANSVGPLSLQAISQVANVFVNDKIFVLFFLFFLFFCKLQIFHL